LTADVRSFDRSQVTTDDVLSAKLRHKTKTTCRQLLNQAITNEFTNDGKLGRTVWTVNDSHLHNKLSLSSYSYSCEMDCDADRSRPSKNFFAF
jgi:hypothetical protein